MKNLTYKKQLCFFCKGKKDVQVSPGDAVLYIGGRYIKCPICEGRGNLNILNAKGRDWESEFNEIIKGAL